jgi:hypothetical protein
MKIEEPAPDKENTEKEERRFRRIVELTKEILVIKKHLAKIYSSIK